MKTTRTLISLLAVGCLTGMHAAATAEDGAAQAETLRGRRPDTKGRLILPVGGLEVDVPKADRAVTEAWGRVGPAEGLGAPSLSDEVAIEAAEGFVALSVAIDTPGCGGFEALEGVATIRVGAQTWLELAQGAIDPAAPDGLAGWVLCGPKVRVHLVTMPAARAAIGKRWLPALAAARKRGAAWREAAERHQAVLVEAGDGTGEVAPWPTQVELVSKAADRLFSTSLALVRRDSEPTDGAVLMRDRFQLLVPAAWQAEFIVERQLGVPCPAPPKAKVALPAGWTAQAVDGGIGACRVVTGDETLVVRLVGEPDAKSLAPALEAFIAALEPAPTNP